MSDDNVADNEEEVVQPAQPEPEPAIKPYRMQMIFTGAHADVEVLGEIYDAVVLEAQRRGIFFDWGGIHPMDMEDVIPGSDLDQVIKGPGYRPS